MSTSTTSDIYSTSLNQLLSHLDPSSPLRSPKIAIVCGSGLGGLAARLQEIVEVDLSLLEGSKGVQSTVVGHKAALAFGYLPSGEGGKERIPVVCQLGRFHYYEGYPPELVTFPVRLFKLLGCDSVILTNAAGSLDPAMKLGTICVIRDHISLPSLTSMNPLIGRNPELFGPRFPPMSDAYNFDLRKQVFRAARALDFDRTLLREGVYAWVAGPTYETRAECKFLRAAGADMVGMSTIPEVIAAHHAGLRVLVLSLATNIVVNAPHRSAEDEVDAELKGETIPVIEEEIAASHQEVLDMSAQRADAVRTLVEKVVELIHKEK